MTQDQIQVNPIVEAAIQTLAKSGERINAKNVFQHIGKGVMPYAVVQLEVQAYKTRETIKNQKGTRLSAPKCIQQLEAILWSDNPDIDDLKAVISLYRNDQTLDEVEAENEEE